MARSRTKSRQPELTRTELRRQLTDEAQRLRSLAAAVRGRMKAPKVEEYVRTGRGPAYQRDHDKWMQILHVAYAFEGAAYRLEEELESPALAG